jgi:hypothetical protein
VRKPALVQNTEICQYYEMTMRHRQSNTTISALRVPIYFGPHPVRLGNPPPVGPGTVRHAI